MNINPILIDLFKDIAPVYPDFYDGKSEEYFVFNYADERAIAYADDKPCAWEATIQIHFYTKKDPQREKSEILKRLEDSDFIIQGVQTIYEGERDYSHTVIDAVVNSFGKGENDG